MAQWKRIQLGTMRLQVRSQVSLSGLRIQHCRGLWCRSQMWLGYGIAVAVVQASSCSSDQTSSLERPYAARVVLKSKKKKKGKKNHVVVPAVSSAPGCRFNLWPTTVGKRIWHCYSSGVGLNCSSDRIPCPGTPYSMGQPKKKKNKTYLCKVPE